MFYIKSCGGDYGTPEDYHPFRGNPDVWRKYPGKFIAINITTPLAITGEGGTEEFRLNYICRRNYCSGNLAYASCIFDDSIF